MDLTSFSDELNKVLRDVNVSLESYGLSHKENLRVIEKFVQDGDRSQRRKTAKRTADLMKHPFTTVLTEELENIPLRSSRSAAKAAATKIRSAVENENEENSRKRRCVVKKERISAPQTVLDVIVEEQENNESSLDVQETPMRQEVACTIHDKPLSDVNRSSKNNNGETQPPFAGHQSPFKLGVANSTFVLDVLQSETQKTDLPKIDGKVKSVSEQSPADSIQNKSCSDTELHSTFIISTGNAVCVSDKVIDEAPEGHREHLKRNKCGPSQARFPNGSNVEDIEVAYVNLQKLIIESPVRVTRTKTRALAQAVAAAAATTKNRDNVQVSGLSNTLMSPQFQKQPNKTTPEDSMKENYTISSEKAMKVTAVKDLSGASRLKAPLSANNTLLSSTLQNSKSNAIGIGTVISHCESFITKSATKPLLAQMNQKFMEEGKYQEDKVVEAEKKKERMLKEKAEQQRRNNEARAAKVAKTREQLERQRAVQQQQQEREKEQRLRIAQQKREEEMALKRLVLHQRAAEAEERRKQEEEQYLLKKKEQEEAERKALQLKKEADEQMKLKEAEKNKKEMNTKPVVSDKKIVTQPSGDVFSTNDIYSGEESEDEEVTLKKVFPSWTSADRARVQLSYQEICAPLIAQLFQSRQHTPDLIKIFGTVPEKALVRTSSAVWHTPPLN